MSNNEKGHINKMSDHLEDFKSELTTFFKELNKKDFDEEVLIAKCEVKKRYLDSLIKFLREKKVIDHSHEEENAYNSLFNQEFDKWWSNK